MGIHSTPQISKHASLCKIISHQGRFIRNNSQTIIQMGKVASSYPSKEHQLQEIVRILSSPNQSRFKTCCRWVSMIMTILVFTMRFNLNYYYHQNTSPVQAPDQSTDFAHNRGPLKNVLNSTELCGTLNLHKNHLNVLSIKQRIPGKQVLILMTEMH